MRQHTKYALFAVVILLLLAIFALLALPPVLRALPGRYRIRLPEPILELVTTPLPTALPAPSQPVAPPRITIPASVPTLVATGVEIAAASVDNLATSPAGETSIPTSAPAMPGPTSTPPVATGVATATRLPPLPTLARIEGLTIIPQGWNNCGPANLVINLNFYGNNTTQEEAAAYLKPNPEDRNVSPWQISDYVNDQTALRATVHSGGNLELLKRFIAAGFPVVVEKGYEPGGSDGWLGHYLTVFGYDDSKQVFYSLDTNLGPWDSSGRSDSYETMATYWQQFNYTFYLVYPPAEEATVNAILGPDLLIPTTMWQKAAEQAQLEIDDDPENAFAWFNLGTSLTRLGELTGQAAYYQNGAAAFDQARTIGIPPRIVWYQFRPYIAYMKVGRYEEMLTLADATLASDGGRQVEETYLYKGHALLYLGDVEGAATNYRQALRLNENFYPAQLALDALQSNSQ